MKSSIKYIKQVIINFNFRYKQLIKIKTKNTIIKLENLRKLLENKLMNPMKKFKPHKEIEMF